MLRRIKVPKTFLEAIAQPRHVLKDKKILSHAEKLRLRLAEYYSKSNNIYNSLEADTGRSQINDEVWNQSGQVMKWLGEYISKENKYFYGNTNRPKEQFHRQEVAVLVNRIIKNEPLAYILGSQPFGPLDIICKSPTLIPRPETEFLSERLAELICKSSLIFKERERKPLKILDLCTGTGCIALLLQHRLYVAGINSEITAVDKSESALKLANQNYFAAGRLRAERQENNGKAKVEVLLEQLDIFDDTQTNKFFSLNGPFDILVSNPPYISTTEWKGLEKGVRDWEDPEALLGDVDSTTDDGLAFYKRIAHLIKQHHLIALNSSTLPNFLVEVGHTQANQVQDILTDTGCFSKSTIIKDPWYHDRGVMAWAGPSHHS